MSQASSVSASAAGRYRAPSRTSGRASTARMKWPVLVLFLPPALLLFTVFVVLPMAEAAWYSFYDWNGYGLPDFSQWVGWKNYEQVFRNGVFRQALINNGLIILISVLVQVPLAIWLATMAASKVKGAITFRLIFFLPYILADVAAGIIWRFVYEYKSAGREQIGLFNAIAVAFGNEPVQWLQGDPVNTFLLIIVMIWIQTGFAMVVLSAAIKGIPTEQIEAAQLDGTNGWQRFRNVTVPGIRGSLVVVLTTISIATLKVFDIVRTMTAGNFNTSVVANEMYTQAFRASEVGRGSALAIILFVLVLPIVIYNINMLRKQREIR